MRCKDHDFQAFCFGTRRESLHNRFQILRNRMASLQQCLHEATRMTEQKVNDSHHFLYDDPLFENIMTGFNLSSVNDLSYSVIV